MGRICEKDVVDLRFAITGKDARFDRLRELLLADGHEPAPEEEADVVIPPPWDKRARYANSESYRIANAALTAEAAAALLDQERPLKDAKVLILGWGRVGALTAEALRSAGAAVAAADRSEDKRAWAAARGFRAVDTKALGSVLRSADAVVNTIPAPLLTGKLIEQTKPEVLLLELASAPGGIDEKAAREQGRRYLSAPGLPGKYAPDRAARILRDAVYETMKMPLPRLGIALTGSHCTFDTALNAVAPFVGKYELVPILSETAAGTDTRFGPASEFRARLEKLCAMPAADSIAAAEPLGTRAALDALLIAPCTGNTLGKLAHGITDTTVTMAAKAHLRNSRPLILAISTNDGLSGSAESIARLLQRKNVYFVPFRQDAPHAKPFSLQADFDLLEETVAAALRGEQLQPLLV